MPTTLGYTQWVDGGFDPLEVRFAVDLGGATQFRRVVSDPVSSSIVPLM